MGVRDSRDAHGSAHLVARNHTANPMWEVEVPAVPPRRAYGAWCHLLAPAGTARPVLEVSIYRVPAQAHDVAHHAQRHLVGAVRRLTDATIHIGPAGAHHPPAAAAPHVGTTSHLSRVTRMSVWEGVGRGEGAAATSTSAGVMVASRPHSSNTDLGDKR